MGRLQRQAPHLIYVTYHLSERRRSADDVSWRATDGRALGRCKDVHIWRAYLVCISARRPTDSRKTDFIPASRRAAIVWWFAPRLWSVHETIRTSVQSTWAERKSERNGAGRKSSKRERDGERAWRNMVKREQSAEREVAERERSGERVEMAAQNPLKALNWLL